jgi:hypothetical protein
MRFCVSDVGDKRQWVSPLILTREIFTPLKARSIISVVGLAGAQLPALEWLLAQTAPQEALPHRVAQSLFEFLLLWPCESEIFADCHRLIPLYWLTGRL